MDPTETQQLQQRSETYRYGGFIRVGDENEINTNEKVYKTQKEPCKNEISNDKKPLSTRTQNNASSSLSTIYSSSLGINTQKNLDKYKVINTINTKDIDENINTNIIEKDQEKNTKSTISSQISTIRNRRIPQIEPNSIIQNELSNKSINNDIQQKDQYIDSSSIHSSNIYSTDSSVKRQNIGQTSKNDKVEVTSILSKDINSNDINSNDTNSKDITTDDTTLNSSVISVSMSDENITDTIKIIDSSSNNNKQDICKRRQIDYSTKEQIDMAKDPRVPQNESQQAASQVALPSYEYALYQRKLDKGLIPYFHIDQCKNPAQVAHYIHDIWVNWRISEKNFQLAEDFMSRQQHINHKMREILIDWLVEVHQKFKQRRETLYLTVSLIDRFIERRQVKRQKLQLVGCAAMLIAAKYEEIYAPEVQDFVYVSDHAYSREQIIAMESIMLTTLEFRITIPYSLRFMERIILLCECLFTWNDNGCIDTTNTNEIPAFVLFVESIYYFLELTLQEYIFLSYLPSIIGCAAVSLALQLFQGRTWKTEQIQYTGYRYENIKYCVDNQIVLLKQKNCKNIAVRSKYSSSKHYLIAIRIHRALHPEKRNTTVSSTNCQTVSIGADPAIEMKSVSTSIATAAPTTTATAAPTAVVTAETATATATNSISTRIATLDTNAQTEYRSSSLKHYTIEPMPLQNTIITNTVDKNTKPSSQSKKLEQQRILTSLQINTTNTANRNRC